MLTKKQKEQSAKILDSIYAEGPISRVELSRKLGITPATMTIITHYLMDTNVIYEVGEELDGYNVGRKKIILDITPQYTYYLGIEIFYHSMSLCITDNKGNIFAKKIIKITEISLEDYFASEQIYSDICDFRAEYAIYPLSAIGFLIPTTLSQTGKPRTNLPFWKDLDTSKIAAVAGIPTYFAPLTNSLALSQRLFNPKLESDNFILLHIRRKILMAYVEDGVIQENKSPLVGELGHIVINPQGESCACGKRGCLQTYLSEDAIVRKAKMIYDVSENTFLHNIVKKSADIDFSTVIQAFRLGDEAATILIKNAMKHLALALINLSMLIDTDEVVLHGDFFNTTECVELLKQYLLEISSPCHPTDTHKLSFFPYQHTNGALAACAYAIHHHLINGF